MTPTSPNSLSGKTKINFIICEVVFIQQLGFRTNHNCTNVPGLPSFDCNIKNAIKITKQESLLIIFNTCSLSYYNKI